jgi:hypothetical protein
MSAVQPKFIDVFSAPEPPPPGKPVPVVPEVESRREHRQRVLKGATIISTGSTSEVGCTIRNQNVGGAELRGTLGVVVPAHFLLYVPVDGVAYQAEIRWRRNDRIGVQFAGKEPKPIRHYG